MLIRTLTCKTLKHIESQKPTIETSENSNSHFLKKIWNTALWRQQHFSQNHDQAILLYGEMSFIYMEIP